MYSLKKGKWINGGAVVNDLKMQMRAKRCFADMCVAYKTNDVTGADRISGLKRSGHL